MLCLIAATHKMENQWRRTQATSLLPALSVSQVESHDASPFRLLNLAVEQEDTEYIAILPDGARMLSPGLIDWTKKALTLWPDSFVYCLSMHLGTNPQTESESERIAETVKGYDLFSHSYIAGSHTEGFWGGATEATFFAMRRDTFLEMGGFNEKFQSPGGGYCNLEFFKRANQIAQPVCILGEATFHQYHGGVSSNCPQEEKAALRKLYEAEYEEIMGEPYKPCWQRPHYIGHVPAQAEWIYGGTQWRVQEWK